jgi:RHS repeat-associated protein
MAFLSTGTRIRRSSTALITLTSYVWVMVAPTVAYAQDAVGAEPAQMVPLAEYERLGGGSLSTAGDRSRSATGDVGQDDAPRASTGDGFEEVAGEGEDDQNGDGSGPAREGENDGAPTDEAGGDGDEPSTDALTLPSGDDKSGVTSQSTPMPQGAGSIQGMGESFSAQLSTGIATFSVPFALMKARGGAQPSLGLSYSSAGGTGPSGQGWSVGVPFIARQTDRGLPKYKDGCNSETKPTGWSCESPSSWHPEQDHFVFNGGQELVPICTVTTNGACTGALAGEVMPDWAAGYQYFRPRVEGSFLRFFWAPDHQSWIVQDKSGTIMEIGRVNGNGPAPGGVNLAGNDALERNPDDTSEIYRWHLSRQYDQHVSGTTPRNLVVYDYTQVEGQAYVTDIYDTSPAANPTTTDVASFAHHTRLRWEERPDRTESYRSGWLIGSTRRLAGVDVASKTYMGGTSDPRKQVRRYHLSYHADYHRSLLTSVQVEGRCGASEMDAITPSEVGGNLPESTGCGRLPAMTFGYSQVEGYQPNGDPDPESIAGYTPFDGRVLHLAGSPNHSIDEGLTDFFDVNSDGLPDVLVTAPGLYNNGHAIFFNGNNATHEFGYQATPGEMSIFGVLGANAGSITLNNLNISPQDLDGDGRINLLHMPTYKTYSVYDSVCDGLYDCDWVGRVIDTANNQNVKIDFGNDTLDTKVMDVNFDGLVDVVVSTGTEYQTFYSLGRYAGGDGQFGSATWTAKNQASMDLNPVTTCVPHSALPVRFSDADTKLADMNGDGITDIVRVRRGDIQYWPGRGNGFWGTGLRDDCEAGTFGADRYREMEDAPQYSDIEGTTLRLNDVDGDGLDDLVQFNYDSVDIWLNVDGKGFTEKKKLDGTPYHAGFHNRVRVIDVNGSGTSDILWGDANDYKYIDLQGGEKPYILTEVANGLGKTTSLEYSTSAVEMLTAAASGNDCDGAPESDRFAAAWCSWMPAVTHVVKRVTERDNITIRGRPPAEYVTEYEYRDPVYEGRQREFRGFARARARRLGDANSPTDVSESVFLLGECLDPADGTAWDGRDQDHYCAPPNRWADNPYEALKGLPVETHKMDANGVHLATTENEYTIRDLYEGLDGRKVRHAFLSKTDSLLYDSGAQNPGRVDIDRRGFVDENAWNPASSPSAPAAYAGGMAHLRTSSTVDSFGNKLSAVNEGCVGGAECPENFGLGADETITQVTEPVLLAHPGGWMWRTNRSYVRGENQARRNESLTAYDSLGRPNQVSAVLTGANPADYGVIRRQPGALTPGGAAANETFVQSTTTYDDFGNAVRTRAVNNRCAEVSYDGFQTGGSSYTENGYAIFAKIESISTSDTAGVASTAACSTGNLLTTSAVYDRGIGVVTLATDLNLRNTLAVYDEFGRITRLHKPSAYKAATAGATYQTHPSVSIQYFLPTDLGGTKHSIIYTETQDGTDEDDTVRQIKSYAYVDGFGRTLVTLSEADPSTGPGLGNDGGAWIAGSLIEWDQKSAVSKKYMPFFWNGDPMAFNYGDRPTTAYGRQRYDAFGRQVQTFDLDRTITLQSRYHALSTDLWDAADLTPGQHQGSYASERKDGHGRTARTTERFRARGSLEERHVQTTYLPTGEPTSITRVQGTSTSGAITRWMQYDSLGRMVLNVEPNTTSGFVVPTNLQAPTVNYATLEAWRYQYNHFGDLIATSDARGCGQNFYYDGAGRILGEDYAPCEPHHEAYSAPSGPTDYAALEVAYFYDAPSAVTALPGVAPSGWTGSVSGGGFTRGRAVAVLDRGSASFTTYDGRGRTVKTQSKIAVPRTLDAAGKPTPIPNIASRYAPRVYARSMAYDAADREVTATTGAAELVASNGTTKLVPELLNSDGQSACTTEYSARGSVKEASSSYGSLVSSLTRTADNLVTEIVYGDAAATRTSYLYDERRRISSVQTYRGPPSSGAWDPTNPNSSTTNIDEPTRQLVLQDEDFLYDVVGNPVEVRDWRDASEWPDGAKPVTKKIEYDDLYRATRIRYEYSAGDDTWTSPHQADIDGSAANNDPRRAKPSPHIQFTRRMLEQTFEYDWVGNNRKTGDDANGFYDRSLGTIDDNDEAGKPYQLKGAALAGGTGGSLQARYDAAGHMTKMQLARSGPCLGGTSSGDCSQQFRYEWDEVGRLARARRWDNNVTSVDTFDPANTATPVAADLRYTYDASDQRVLKEAVDLSSQTTHSYTAYIFETLELRRAQFGDQHDGIIDGVSEYEINHYTVVPYLLANGVRLSRVVYHITGDVPEEAYDGTGAPGDVDGPQTSNGKLHVFFELGDHLGSTSVVLDKATGELVERATFQGYGGAESDYRPDRWKSFREDYRFTGKEEDVEVGLQYFGKRYLNPLLGRWISADPLAVHAPGEADLNVYAYVRGAVLKSIDPVGLEDSEVNEHDGRPPNEQKPTWLAKAGLGIADMVGRAARPACNLTPNVCGFIASRLTGKAYWQQRLLDHYVDAKGSKLDLTLGDSRSWVRDAAKAQTPISPFQRELSDVWRKALTTAAKTGESQSFSWQGDTYEAFDGPGSFKVHWDIEVSILTVTGEDGKRSITTTYQGKMRMTDTWDFDPQPVETSHRPAGAELKTRLGQAVAGQAFEIDSGELRVHGTLAGSVVVDGKVPDPIPQLDGSSGRSDTGAAGSK